MEINWIRHLPNRVIPRLLMPLEDRYFIVMTRYKKYDYVAEAFRHISVGSMGGEMIVPSILAGDKNNYRETVTL